MQDLLAFLVVILVAVGGAETVRAVCANRLSSPAPLPVRDEQPVPALND